MNVDLSGMVAVVTGAGRGVGRAVAGGLAECGAAVALVARSQEQIEDAAEEIQKSGGRSLPVVADVTSPRDVDRIVVETTSKLGPVDLLVNNAGALERGARLWEADIDGWQNTMAVNVFGPFLLSKAVLPSMVERGHGRIINVSSGASVIPGGYTGFSAYGASKAALNRITETLATEAGPYGIQVFAVHPGVLRTDLLSRNLEAEMDEIAPGRGQRMWEVNDSFERPTELCLSLASGAADALSGCYISVNDDLEQLIAHSDAVKEKDLFRMRIVKGDL